MGYTNTMTINVDSPKLPAREGVVKYPVSYRYNGGIIVEGKWHDGYEVGDPIVPDGYELVGMGVGLQLNSRPPIATEYLQKVKKARKAKK